MIKRMIIMIFLVGIIFGGIFGYHAFMGQLMKKMMSQSAMPPAVVSASKTQLLPWQPKLKAVGTVRSVRGVEVTSEVPGIVEVISFKAGMEVKEGQVLVQLKADSDIAQLRALKIDAGLANTNYERDLKLLEAQAVSQATVDTDLAQLESKRAQVAAQEALVAKKTIKAPFAGRLGISALNPGQYLNPGEKIVTLQLLDSVYIDFYLPQQEIPRLVIGQTVDIKTDTYPDRAFIGKITAINPKVETDSRNVLVEVIVPNPKHELLSGMYVTVEVLAGDVRAYLTVPQAAVTFNPYGETVYVIAEKGKAADGKPNLLAEQRFVTVGETRGDQLAILEGLKEGDLIVTSGQMKLKNGSAIIINNQIQPTNEADPKPSEQ